MPSNKYSDNNTEILLAEWKEIRETLRYFGNKRFAQLTVFIAAEGAAVGAFLNPATAAHRFVFQLAGLLLAFLFYLMERSSVQYWEQFSARARAIEEQLKPLELMTKHRPGEGRFGGTAATYVLYFLTAAFWFFSFACWISNPLHSEKLVIVVAGDGRAEYPSPDKSPSLAAFSLRANSRCASRVVMSSGSCAAVAYCKMPTLSLLFRE